MKEIAEIPDKNLLAALNEAVGKMQSKIRTSYSSIWVKELNQLSGALYFNNKEISNLKGLEYCTGISELNLNDNKVVDLSPLKDLTGLTYLNLHNLISDISKLKSLKALRNLQLTNNKISDISPLASLS